MKPQPFSIYYEKFTLVFNEADEIDFVGPYDVFQRAKRLGGCADVRLVTLVPREEIIA